MDRRSLLKGLLLTALASQMPSAEAAESAAEKLADYPAFSVNGELPHRIEVMDLGADWKRLSAFFKKPTDGVYSFSTPGDNLGLKIMSPDLAAAGDIAGAHVEWGAEEAIVTLHYKVN